MSDTPRKRRLALMPEVLPTPVTAPTTNVRARTMARLKMLTAVGAGVVVSCGKSKGLSDTHKPGENEPYGVVDPMPRPTCFEGPQPTITAAFVKKTSDAGSPSDDRLVDVNVTYTQPDVALGAVTANDVTVVKSEASPKGIRLLVRVPPSTTKVQKSISVSASCAQGMTTIQITLDVTPAEVTAQVYAY